MDNYKLEIRWLIVVVFYYTIKSVAAALKRGGFNLRF